MTLAFDTLAFAEKLKAEGFDERQAKAATEAFAEATAQELATKRDIDVLKADLDVLKAGLEAKIVKFELLRGLVPFLAALLLFVVGLYFRNP